MTKVRAHESCAASPRWSQSIEAELRVMQLSSQITAVVRLNTAAVVNREGAKNERRGARCEGMKGEGTRGEGAGSRDGGLVAAGERRASKRSGTFSAVAATCAGPARAEGSATWHTVGPTRGTTRDQRGRRAPFAPHHPRRAVAHCLSSPLAARARTCTRRCCYLPMRALWARHVNGCAHVRRKQQVLGVRNRPPGGPIQPWRCGLHRARIAAQW